MSFDCAKTSCPDVDLALPFKPAIILIDKGQLESEHFCELLKDHFLKEYRPSIGLNRNLCKFFFIGKNTENSIWQNAIHWSISLCRLFQILPQRSVILPIVHQQQAIQLSIAKLTKEKCGEFVASASDVLDVWKFLNLTSTNDNFSKENDDENINDYCSEIKKAVILYKEFLKSSFSFDHFDLIKLIKASLLQPDCNLKKTLDASVVVIEDLKSMSRTELDLLRNLLPDVDVYKTLSPFSIPNCSEHHNISGIDLNISNLEEEKFSKPVEFCYETKDIENTDIVRCHFELSPIEGSSFEQLIYENLNSITYEGESTNNCLKKGSERYVEQLFLAHIRLLINTRDELALASLLSMPGREISNKDFTKIKSVAKTKNMSIYQTIISTILRLQLGGKGYQPEKSCPIVLHSKPLTEFVDLMHKLQNIIEEEKDGRKAYENILSLIKRTLLRTKGCSLPQKAINSVYHTFISMLQHQNNCFQEIFPENKLEKKDQIACQTLSVNRSLHPALQLLVELCDWSAGKDMNLIVSDIIAEQILTQRTPLTQGKKQSPLRVPSVLSLFSSPNSPNNVPLSPTSKEVGNSTPLRVRMLRQERPSESKKAQDITRFKSCCAWAPDNMSPISKGPWLSGELSPVTVLGPTLKSKATNDKGSIDWVSVFEENSKENRAATSGTLAEDSVSSIDVVPKKRRKRSLLSDISNLHEEESCNKKTKTTFVGKSESKGKISTKRPKLSKNLKPLLSGQMQITSFFKR